MNSSNATQRQQTANEHPQQEARLPGTQKLLLAGNWEWNLETRKYSWSDEMYQIFQLRPRQVPPRTGTFFNSVHPDDREKVVRAFGKALVGEQPYHMEHRIIWPDGSVRFVHGEAAVTFDQAGRPLSMIGTVQDITARRQLEDLR